MIQSQKEQRAHRRKLAAELKNAKKRKARLQKRARLLSTEDLLTVVALREGSGFDASTLFTASQTTREGGPPGEDEEDPALSDGAAREAQDDPVEGAAASS